MKIVFVSTLTLHSLKKENSPVLQLQGICKKKKEEQGQTGRLAARLQSVLIKNQCAVH